MKVLLTGVGGFIGSHCLDYWIRTTDWKIIGLDSFRHKGYISRLREVEKGWGENFNWKNRVKYYTHDLTVPFDPPIENLLLERSLDGGVIVENSIDVIVNMASDSAVERSTTNPIHCLKNNYDLVINMLELARKIKPKLFVQISTDEVYGEALPKPFPGHKEWDEIAPSNPYAASKAAQEAVAIAYWRTYGVPLIITNCMNIIGEWQDPEKFLPKIIQNLAAGKEIPIYADQKEDWPYTEKPEQAWNIGSRIYLDAKNKADALKFLIEQHVSGTQVLPMHGMASRPARFNICGDRELNNLELARMVAAIMKKSFQYALIPSDSARPGYDRRYALDGTKMKEMGWKPPYSLEETLKRVVDWYMVGCNQHWLI